MRKGVYDLKLYIYIYTLNFDNSSVFNSSNVFDFFLDSTTIP